MKAAFMDCYAVYDDNSVIIGNDKIERTYRFAGNVLSPIFLKNKESGYLWGGEEQPALISLDETVQGPLLERSFSAETRDHEGLSMPYLSLIITSVYGQCSQEREIAVHPGLPFLTVHTRVKGNWRRGEEKRAKEKMAGIEREASESRELVFSKGDAIEIFSLPKTHLKTTEVYFYDKTDFNDTLITERTTITYPRGEYRGDGNLFFIEDYQNEEALLVAKDSPVSSSMLEKTQPDFLIHGNRFGELIGSGLSAGENYDDFVQCYGSVIGVGKKKDLPLLFKRYYNREYYPETNNSVMMANTWGDRSQDAAVCDEFIRKEILAAEEIGIDILQIDDGWQYGATSNSKLTADGVWGGYYKANDRFWEVHPGKFPYGLAPVVQFAKEHHVLLGLWFSPDSSDDYSNWRRDVDTVLSLHREYGIDYFKIDAVRIHSKPGERRYQNFLEEVSQKSQNSVRFNLDITADNRYGYLYQRQLGNLFVENRYTDWGNYYPHNTLRNLWMLSRYFPARKFQFELLNNARNKEKYGSDPLAPSCYTLDYEFATVAVSNPLFWMELSGLSAAQTETLRTAAKWYRQCRGDFWNAQVIPIGQMPDGQGFTGFQIVCGNDWGYLLLFRENTKDSQASITLPAHCPDNGRLIFVASNRDEKKIGGLLDSGACIMRADDPRTFVLWKYEA